MTGPNPNKQGRIKSSFSLLGASIFCFSGFIVISSININLIGVFYVKYWSDSFIFIGLVGGFSSNYDAFVIYLWFIPGLGSSL
jgi:hypothetical protein